MAKVEGGFVRAGTLLDGLMTSSVAVGCGGDFGVFPGATGQAVAAAKIGLPIAARLRHRVRDDCAPVWNAGYDMLKFLPRRNARVEAPFLENRCLRTATRCRLPTGGVQPRECGKAICRLAKCPSDAGGRLWFAPDNLMRKGDWAAITELAGAASTLGSRGSKRRPPRHTGR